MDVPDPIHILPSDCLEHPDVHLSRCATCMGGVFSAEVRRGGWAGVKSRQGLPKSELSVAWDTLQNPLGPDGSCRAKSVLVIPNREFGLARVWRLAGPQTPTPPRAVVQNPRKSHSLPTRAFSSLAMHLDD